MLVAAVGERILLVYQTFLLLTPPPHHRSAHLLHLLRRRDLPVRPLVIRNNCDFLEWLMRI